MPLDISATDTELPQPLNAVFNQTLLRNAQVRAPYYAGTMPGSLTTQRGSNVAMWRRIENLTPATTALAELQTTASYGQGRDSAALSVTNVTATMSKYGNFVILNEEVDLFNFAGQFDKILQVIGINAGQSLNRLQRDIGEDNATLVYAGGAASDGAVDTVIELGPIQNVINILDRNSGMTFNPMTTGSTNIGTAPILPSFWMLCHSDVAIDVAGLTGFQSVETYAGQVATAMGEFGALGIAGHAVRCISSEDAGVDADAGNATFPGLRGGTAADLYTTLIYGQDAIGSVGLGEAHTDGIYRAGAELSSVDVIVKAPSSSGTSDPYNEISTVAWKSWHTGAILNPAWVRGIRSGATLLT